MDDERRSGRDFMDDSLERAQDGKNFGSSFMCHPVSEVKDRPVRTVVRPGDIEAAAPRAPRGGRGDLPDAEGVEDPLAVRAPLGGPFLGLRSGHAAGSFTHHHTPHFPCLVGDISVQLKELQRLFSWRGVGSGLSGWELPRSGTNYRETSYMENYSTKQPAPPIYCPVTKKVDPGTACSLLTRAGMQNDCAWVTKWLCDEGFYVGLVRNHPTRSFFRQNLDRDTIETLLKGGIISKDTSSSKSTNRRYCKIFFLPEKSGTRSRIIIEPRDLNRAIQLRNASKTPVTPKITLPTLRDIVNLCTHAKSIECIDFRSYYYQIVLHNDVKKFFSLQLNNETYVCNVLPQGLSASVAIAQRLTEAATRLAIGPRFGLSTYTILTYIDNIYVGYHQEMSPDGSIFDASKIPFEIGSRSMEGPTVNVLGLTLVCGHSIDISARTRSKLAESHDIRSVHTALRVFGLINYVARVLHQGWCRRPQALRVLGRLCGIFLSTGDGALDDFSRKTIVDLLNEAATWPPCGIFSSNQPSVTCYCDASNLGGGAVIVSTNEIRILTWEWHEKLMQTSINWKELAAIETTTRYLTEHTGPGSTEIELYTDSAVAAHILNKGHARHRHLNALAAKILGRGPLRVGWVQGELNPADGPSRGRVNLTEIRERVADVEVSVQEKVTAIRLWYDGGWELGTQAAKTQDSEGEDAVPLAAKPKENGKPRHMI